jgi:molybdopterin/thiamine biosynthesis adenylyltransferase
MKKTQERLDAFRQRQSETSQAFRPEFLRLGEPEQLRRFEELLNTPGLTVTDCIKDQVRDLLRFRHPERRFTAAELDALADEHLGKDKALTYGVWLFYPWSARLVHVLDEKEFIDVRTSRNLYKITREERDLLATKKIGVIGLSVGQSVSVTLAMERVCGELRLADFDTLELTNLNRIRTGLHNLGLPKVYSVAREIAEIDPFITVRCFPEGLHENNLDAFFNEGGRLDLLVEESDGFDIKILSRYKARELRVPVIMEASDRCMVDVERFDLEPDRKILHGIVKNLDVETLKTLKTNEDKIPYMLDILGFDSTTARLRASMLEMQQTVSTWPQLASAVTMGGGITADVSRRMLLNHFTESGRYYVDIDRLIGNKEATERDSGLGKEPQPLSIDRMREISTAFTSIAAEEVPSAHINSILEAAVVAPSFANRQPWRWLNCNPRILLFLDRSDGLPVLDPLHFNSFVSLGCAIENTLQQAGKLGYTATTELLPSQENSELVAVITVKKGGQEPADSLAPYIRERHTVRGAGKAGDLPSEMIDNLRGAVSQYKGATLHLLSDAAALHRLALLCGYCEKVRILHPALHAEYFSRELVFKGKTSDATQGINVKNLNAPAAFETALHVLSAPEVASLLASWNKGSVIEKTGTQALSGTLLAGLITMKGNELKDWVTGGMAAERAWLTATKNSLAFQPICLPLTLSRGLGKSFNAPENGYFDFRAVSEQLDSLFERGVNETAVFMFRLFKSDAQFSPSLRRPLHELVFNC